MEKIEDLLDWGGMKKDIVYLIISGIALFVSIFLPNILPFDVAWVAIVLCGIPIVLEAIIGLITRFDIKADVLVSIALIASLFIGEYFAAGEVAFIMQLGALLEDLTVAKAHKGIEKLVNLTPQTARVITNKGEKIVPAEQVNINDVLRVLPGETIAVDGVIISGETSINQAIMTGESLPVDKGIGDEVASGTVNQFGVFEMRATKVGENSSIQRMIKLVKSADAKKAKIVSLADRWATWIVFIALISAILTWVISGEVIRAVTILVVFCPCSLVLATPTAIMAAIGNATKHSFLVRQGDALERLASVTKVCFDKTGTLTYGTPKVIKVGNISNFTKEEFFALVASAEQFSEHPIGKAIVKAYKSEYKADLFSASDFNMSIGKGISSNVDNHRIIAGNLNIFEKNNSSNLNKLIEKTNEHLKNGCTVVYASIDGEMAGYIVLADTIRDESKNMIDKIKELKIMPILLTGDNEKTAENISNQLGIDDFIAKCLPKDKLDFIDDCQKNAQSICMIGDGINDAPALKTANIGIAMGGIGSDIAVEAADIVLVDDKIKEFPHLLALSKKMMITIKLNMIFSMSLNFLAITLAIIGILNPIVGALVHNAGSVAVIINSALLLKWKK